MLGVVVYIFGSLAMMERDQVRLRLGAAVLGVAVVRASRLVCFCSYELAL